MVFKRKSNVFERILLPIAFIVGIYGFYLIFTSNTELAFLKIIAVFSWLILIFLMIIAATNEDVKEEISTIIKDQNEEIKIIKDVSHDSLAELKMLRQDLKRKK